MDVICYWKKHEADLKAGRLGHFKSTPDNLTEFTDGFPDFLWAFTTPRGGKGKVQLLAKLRWADKSTVGLKREPGIVYIHYDPRDAQSVAFGQGSTDAAIAATSSWVARHFPKMLATNFQGSAGQAAIRGTALIELQQLAATLGAQPFAETVGVEA